MPGASSINWYGLRGEDPVANFVVLPNSHEDEAMATQLRQRNTPAFP